MSDEEQLPATVDEVVARIERGRTEFYAALDGLSDEQLAAPLTERAWSAADHMAHIAVWMEGIVGALEGRSRWAVMGAGPPDKGDYDRLNEELRAQRGALSPAEARAWLDATHERLLEKLRSMTIDELRRPYDHYQPGEGRANGGEPFLNWIIGDSYEHYDEHRGWITAALGR